MCPDWESNRLLFGSQACTQSIELHQPGMCVCVFCYLNYIVSFWRTGTIHWNVLFSKINCFCPLPWHSGFQSLCLPIPPSGKYGNSHRIRSTQGGDVLVMPRLGQRASLSGLCFENIKAQRGERFPSTDTAKERVGLLSNFRKRVPWAREGAGSGPRAYALPPAAQRPWDQKQCLQGAPRLEPHCGRHEQEWPSCSLVSSMFKLFLEEEINII